jgi:hypothetical protein
VDKVQGVPEYRHPDGPHTIVLTRSTKPLFLPLSQEEYLRAAIKKLEGEIAEDSASLSDPVGEAYRQWQAEKPEREKERRETYAEMKAQNPKLAEQFLQAQLKTESETEAMLKLQMAEHPATDLQQHPLMQRLKRHKALLASLSASERAAQARYLRAESPLDPDLAPSGSQSGIPLVVSNSEFLDRSLPPSAIQIMAFTFVYGNTFDPDAPNSLSENVPAYRLHQMRRTANWKQIASILAP